jgi:hypothetical protein
MREATLQGRAKLTFQYGTIKNLTGRAVYVQKLTFQYGTIKKV